jgi:hypothetical protein
MKPKPWLLIPLFLLALPGLAAKDQVTGTFTVQGKTTVLRHVYASLDADPGDPGTKYVVLLLSDEPIAEEDRRSSRIAELAREGRLHAVKVRWRVGYDDLAAVPYHQAVAETGTTVRGMGKIDLKAFDDDNVDAKVGSRRLGQDWHYSAHVKAALRHGGTAEIEPAMKVEMEKGTRSHSMQPQPGEAGDPILAIKKQLGQQGYEFDTPNLIHAIHEGDVAAVRLFMKGGMDPNFVAKDDGRHPMLIAAMSCSLEDNSKATPILLALLQAKGDPDAKDDNNSTALLWAASSCDAEVIRAMIKAGADVNARAKGSATPLMMAEVSNRTEIAEILKAAGAKPWRR